MKKIFLFLLLCLSIGVGIPSANETHDIAVFKPANAEDKLPTVFLAHNGGAKKEDWGAFPRELADNGYLVLNIGWTEFSLNTDVKKAVLHCIDKYREEIDFERIAFLGGCHGGVKLISLLDDSEVSEAFDVSTLIALSISETTPEMMEAAQNNPHPLLIIYTLRDQYGYSEINASFAESVTGNPKKVITIDATPHGNEMLLSEKTNIRVSAAIKFWLHKYLQ